MTNVSYAIYFIGFNDEILKFVFFFVAFECKYCHKFYKYKGDLTKHLQIHVGDNIYTCDVCGQGFRYHDDFKHHSFVHYKEDRDKNQAIAQSSSSMTAIEKE